MAAGKWFLNPLFDAATHEAGVEDKTRPCTLLAATTITEKGEVVGGGGSGY